MSLNTFDEVDQAVIDDCFCRYTGEEIKKLISGRDQARAERDKLAEFGEYLAKSAERFGENVNGYALVCNEISCDLDEATDAELAMADSWRALKSAIHGFRKKAKLEDRNDV